MLNFGAQPIKIVGGLVAFDIDLHNAHYEEGWTLFPREPLPRLILPPEGVAV